LSGCVNYAGVHDNKKSFDDAMLNSSYSDGTYSTHKVQAATNSAWWDLYHDAQLNQLIATALHDSPTLQTAQARLESAQHIAEAAGASLWPTASAYANIQRERLTENTFFPPPYGGNNYTEINLGVTFNYEFDFWGKNRANIAALTTTAYAEAAELNASKLILASSVANTYFQLKYALANLKTTQQIMQQRKEILSIVFTRIKHGVDSEIPATSAITDYQNAQIAVAAAQAQIKLAKHLLAALIGQNPFTTDITTNALNYHKNNLRLPKVIPANMLAHRPDVIASRWQAQSAAARVKIAKARFYPNVNLAGLLSLQTFVPSRTFQNSSRDNYVGAAFDLPIFDAGRRRANLATRYAQYDVAVEQYNQTILTGLREVADQVSIAHKLQAQEMDLNRSLAAAQKNYELLRARYQHGITEYVSVLKAHDNLLQEKNQQLQLAAQQLKASVAMIKALGGASPY
jgi:NodT family efflux transporter outer membrane factor (OMF) lipoprotein